MQHTIDEHHLYINSHPQILLMLFFFFFYNIDEHLSSSWIVRKLFCHSSVLVKGT